MEELEKKLKAPFPENAIEWRISRSGVKKDGAVWATCLAYVTSRAIQDRLDSVFGIGGWYDEYVPAPQGGVLCKLHCKIDEAFICKQDVAENTQFEGVKGGVSGALKRAAVKFGIGRYLYDLPEGFAVVNNNGKHYQSANTKKGIPAFNWDAPQLPAWALPDGASTAKPAPAKPAKSEIDIVKSQLSALAKAKGMDTEELVAWLDHEDYNKDDVQALKQAKVALAKL
jgi:hypothetical protein